MHLLAATPGRISDGNEAVELGQSPGDIVFLSAADSEIALVANAHRTLAAGFPSLRVANLQRLGHPLSVDLYVESIIAKARLVVVRVLGGRAYWPYGIEQIALCCRQARVSLALLPGDERPDEDLATDTTLPADQADRLWRYLIQGGAGNAENLLRYAASLIGHAAEWREPAPLPPAGLYPAGTDLNTLRRSWSADRPAAAIVVYRALVQAGDVAPLDALIGALRETGLNPLPIFVSSLKDPVSAAMIGSVFAALPPDVVVNATGFAVAAPGRPEEGPFAQADCPVLQVILAGSGEPAWRQGLTGLGPKDIAMNVALPEVDGRIITRAISFKGLARRDDAVEADIVAHVPVPDRVAFVAELAANWAKLRRKAPVLRRVGVILANYPNRDGRIGNGVGLDTPAGTVEVLNALQGAGYRVDSIPQDGAALLRLLQAGPTNDWTALSGREERESLSLAEYMFFLNTLPADLVARIRARWGPPEGDPFFRPGELDCGRFVLPIVRLGNIAVGVQPARGYNLDPAASYHDPDLLPPHSYLAFYAWLRRDFRVDAIVHMGKHGNLEWLPGKALALSAACLPEAAFGPLPHLYPFIVNDPGEGTQAKRRAQAVIIDHLTPPLTRAETYGVLRELEVLVDEYYEASGLDPRRCAVLEKEILALARASGLDQEVGIRTDDDTMEALKKLDNQLCELKEMQIRDGLHVFGRSPEGALLTDLLVALVRTPRGARPEDCSLLRALSVDLGLGFDPLDCVMADPWTGARPDVLAHIPLTLPNPPSPARGEGGGNAIPPSPLAVEGPGVRGNEPWRSNGDTVERLEAMARALVSATMKPDPAWTGTRAILHWIETILRPNVQVCGPDELAGLLTGLDGRFVPPGPSGAPTRGRPDVLPTGRNFFSVDTRTLPTQAAWALGWKSAGLLLERHLQDQGDWPRAMALTAWGTSNMRTGGDDIAQALALLGVRPTWDTVSRRVSGFEILPVSILDRPRVDVTLRISGFFRDAFPNLVDLFDSAIRAVAALDEPEADNPLAARVRTETARLMADGVASAMAERRASYRVFGSKPGAYGAGLQALIDEKGWQDETDLARAFVAWGGYAYGAGAEGKDEHALFEERLSRVQAVVQNQDNREHDLLDSDDYYQFEGGMTAAVRVISGSNPQVYHNDHARPESPRIRTLEEEIARVIRARVINPKWIAGVMRHGYKGAFEMAATVDYVFAFQATARCVKDHHFDAICDSYLGDESVRAFLEDSNPAALRDMAERLREALERGLWQPRRNDMREVIETVLGRAK
jgi:cobaltochelatase CobN